MSEEPTLPEFESAILHYEELEEQIESELEHYDVGPVALFTGMPCIFLQQQHKYVFRYSGP